MVQMHMGPMQPLPFYNKRLRLHNIRFGKALDEISDDMMGDLVYSIF